MHSANKKTILVVEDNPSLNKLIVLELKEAGCNVILAENAEKALEFLRMRKPDLIWLDIYLPSMDGFQFLKYLREDPETKDMKVVVVSVSGSNSKMDLAKEFNILNYFVKSNYRLDELVKEVLSVMNRG